MPSQKKQQNPPICTSTSRRILKNVPIKDLPQARLFCIPSSCTTSPSESRLCVCDQEECGPGVCCTLEHQCKASNGNSEQQRPTATCAPKCKGLNGSMTDMPSCHQMLQTLAQEAFKTFNPNNPPAERRVSIQDPNGQNTDTISDCCKPASSMQKGPLSKSPFDSAPIPQKNGSCCEFCKNLSAPVETNTPVGPNQTKPPYQAKPVVQNNDCSLENCSRDALAAENSDSSKSTSTQSDDTLDESRRKSGSNGATGPQLRQMPLASPTPSRKSSGTIANNSSQKLFGRLGTSNSKDATYDARDETSSDEEGRKKENKPDSKKSNSLYKLFGRFSKNNIKEEKDVNPIHENDNSSSKKESKADIKKRKQKESNNDMTVKTKDKSASLTRPCGKPSCAVNTCTCHFPPAYSQYFDCTGRIGGNCNCDKNN